MTDTNNKPHSCNSDSHRKRKANSLPGITDYKLGRSWIGRQTVSYCHIYNAFDIQSLELHHC